MAKNTQLTNLAVNTEGDALAALLNAGKIAIYDGSQPATGDTAIGAQVLLATLTFANPAFGASSGGVITANAISSAAAVATSTAAWFRCFKSDGTTAVFDGSVGTASANMIIGTTSIVALATVSCSSFTHTLAKSTSGQ